MNEKQKRKGSVLMFLLLLAITSCNLFGTQNNGDTKLPFIGPAEVSENGDSIPYSIPKFSFINQDSKEVSHNTMKEKVFVADFFFTSCPSICPMLSSQMVRLQAKVKDAGLHDEVRFLSHTVDPKHDLPDTLKSYASLIGADLTNWDFVTGNAEDVYYQAEKGYLLSAFPSDSADGGFFHTDKIALIDKQLHIRGLYDGTSTKEVDQLFNDIKILLHE